MINKIYMDYLRTIVSGHKKRFIQDGFNLDLTYITDRIVAMAFPAEGFESLYRNPINKVAFAFKSGGWVP